MLKKGTAVISEERQEPMSLGDAEEAYFRKEILRIAGISLSESKRPVIEARLRARVTELGYAGFSEYRQFLAALPEDHPEWQTFVNLITTNKTDFFREPDHFNYLCEGIASGNLAKDKPTISIWSAACSTGEEAYTIAMTVQELVVDRVLKIYATDIDTSVLEIAKNGVYPVGRLAPVPQVTRDRCFMLGTGEIAQWAKLRPEIKKCVEFHRLNLIHPPFSNSNRFDAIFCRNVLIYFDQATILKVVEGLYDSAAPGAVLFTGHSESLNGIATRWKFESPSIYRKKGGSSHD